MTIKYTITGISKNFTPPGLPDAAVVPSYTATIQPEGSIPQFNISVDKSQLAKYQVDATGTIVLNDPA